MLLFVMNAQMEMVQHGAMEIVNGIQPQMNVKYLKAQNRMLVVVDILRQPVRIAQMEMGLHGAMATVNGIH